MVMSVESQDSQNFSRAQSNADIDHPDQPVAKRRTGQWQALQHRGRLDAHQRESGHPVDDRLGTWHFMDAKGWGQYVQYSADGPKPDVSHQKELQCQEDQVHFVLKGRRLALHLQPAQVSPGLFELFLEAIPLLFGPDQFLAQIPIFLTSLPGLGFPLISALPELGPLAHCSLFCQSILLPMMPS